MELRRKDLREVLTELWMDWELKVHGLSPRRRRSARFGMLKLLAECAF